MKSKDEESLPKMITIITRRNTVIDNITQDSFRFLISKDTASKFYKNFDINQQSKSFSFSFENQTLLDILVEAAIDAITSKHNTRRYNQCKMLVKCILDEYPNECYLDRALPSIIGFEDGDFLSEILCHSKEFMTRIKQEKIYCKLKFLERTVNTGRLQQFIKIILILINICNVNNVKELESCKIVNQEMISRWINICNKMGFHVFSSFLTKLNENVLRKNSWDIFCVMFGINSDGNYNNSNNEEVEQLSVKFGKDLKSAKYLFNNCKKDTLIDLANVINNGLNRQECNFSDSLLMLSKMTDNENFTKTLANTTQECLSHEKKTIVKYCYFKNNLLDSNIWAMESESLKHVTSEKDKKKEDAIIVKSDHEEKNEMPRKLLFDQVEEKVILNELKCQQMFIQNAIISEEKNNKDSFEKLKQFGKTRTNDDTNITLLSKLLQMQRGRSSWDDLSYEMLHAKHSLNTLPFDNVNGFDGRKEFDQNYYLTELLILSHEIDSKFQNECKNIFTINNKDFGIKCIFSSGNVKTRARSITKCELDYKNGKYKWPHTQHIKDLLRCSVVFDNIDDLLNGCKKFEKIINVTTANALKESYRDKKLSNKCIQEIIRIKNGFSDIEDESWKLGLKSFNYCDIKYNVLICTNKIREHGNHFSSTCLIGEVQFLLKFMLKAKKMGHSVYSFVRKKDLFNSINKTYNLNNFNIIERKIKEMIVSKNMSKLSLYFENIKENQLEYIKKNKEIFTYLFKDQIGWTKGLKLFNNYV